MPPTPSADVPIEGPIAVVMYVMMAILLIGLPALALYHYFGQPLLSRRVPNRSWFPLWWALWRWRLRWGRPARLAAFATLCLALVFAVPACGRAWQTWGANPVAWGLLAALVLGVGYQLAIRVGLPAVVAAVDDEDQPAPGERRWWSGLGSFSTPGDDDTGPPPPLAAHCPTPDCAAEIAANATSCLRCGPLEWERALLTERFDHHWHLWYPDDPDSPRAAFDQLAADAAHFAHTFLVRMYPIGWVLDGAIGVQEVDSTGRPLPDSTDAAPPAGPLIRHFLFEIPVRRATGLLPVGAP